MKNGKDGVERTQFFTQNGGLGTPSNVTVSATTGLGILAAITSSDPTDYVRKYQATPATKVCCCFPRFSALRARKSGRTRSGFFRRRQRSMGRRLTG